SITTVAARGGPDGSPHATSHVARPSIPYVAARRADWADIDGFAWLRSPTRGVAARAAGPGKMRAGRARGAIGPRAPIPSVPPRSRPDFRPATPWKVRPITRKTQPSFPVGPPRRR